MTKLEKTFANKSQRKTPRMLRIIAALDDKQDKRLKEVETGDLGVLRWDCIEAYFGPTIRGALQKSLVT